MKPIRLPLLALLMFCTLTANKCSKADGTPMDPMTALAGSRWNLQTLAGRAFQLPEGVENPYITLGTDGALSGFNGCNSLMGTMKVDAGSLSFPGLGSTKKFCDNAKATESGFMNALRATNSFTLDGDVLTLLDKEKELATLRKGK